MNTLRNPYIRSAIAGVSLYFGATVAGGSATFLPIGDLDGGAFQSSVSAISGDGTTVVGWSAANDNAQGDLRAYRWRQSIGITALGHIGTDTENGIANAVSFDGAVIVGRSGDAFRWTQATGMQSIGDCAALGISGNGATVVGFCATTNGNEAATWNALDDWTTFGALGSTIIDAFFFDADHDGSTFSGQSFMESPDVEPTHWTKLNGMVALGDIPGGLHYGLALAISADGSTIVGDAIGDVGQDAFLWTTNTGLVNLELAERGAVTDSHAHDVSGDGAFIVGLSDRHGAMIWDETRGMRSVQQLATNIYGLDLTGWTLLGAEAISDNGRVIAGNGTNPNGDFEAWILQLPPFCAAGDVDDNNVVNVFDLLELLQTWGACVNCPADFTDAAAGPPDGQVNVFDLLALLENWGTCPIP